MDKDSEIRRLREYIHLQLRREMKENNNERSGIFFFLKEGVTKSRTRKAHSDQSDRTRKSKKDKFSHARDQKRTQEIREEIGRNVHTIRQNPYQVDEVLSDVKIESYPVPNGYYAAVSLRDDENIKKSKIFVDEAEVDVWIRNVALEMTQQFTQ